jgi:AraC family transcriptional regulator
MTEILPASPYRHAGTPDMEVYSQGNGNSADYYSEVWIPIVEK